MCDCDICHETGEAADNARRLLHQHLTRWQRRKLHKRNGSIVIKGNMTGNKYRLYNCAEVNRLIDDHGFCLELRELETPLADHILAKKILIEADEQTFLEVANDLSA